MGEAVTLRAGFDGWPTPQVEWYRDGVKLAQIGPELTLASASEGDSGLYRAVATNSAGHVSSREARVVVGDVDMASLRLSNVSTRAGLGSGERTLIPGFVIGGSGRKEVILRGVGPAMPVVFPGFSGAATDTAIHLFAGGSLLASNDDWVATEIGDGFNRVGAFALPDDSKDAAMRLVLDPGVYTLHVVGAGDTGISLAEIYDMDRSTSARIVNLSTRGQVDGGDGAMIGGFVIEGSAPKLVLIRGIGPSLALLGVADALRDPVLVLVEIGTPNRTIASNDDWWSDPMDGARIDTAAKAVGAFDLPSGSKDAALLVWLEPGTYTALLQGVRGDSGVGLIEIYER